MYYFIEYKKEKKKFVLSNCIEVNKVKIWRHKIIFRCLVVKNSFIMILPNNKE